MQPEPDGARTLLRGAGAPQPPQIRAFVIERLVRRVGMRSACPRLDSGAHRLRRAGIGQGGPPPGAWVDGGGPDLAPGAGPGRVHG